MNIIYNKGIKIGGRKNEIRKIQEKQKKKKYPPNSRIREFVNLLDHFYRGYQRKLVLFSKSFGDRYPIEECILIGL